MASLQLGLVIVITMICYADAAEIVSPSLEKQAVQVGSDVELICHSSPDEGQIIWSYNGMTVNPDLPSFDVRSEEISDGGKRVVVTTLILRDMSATRGITYKCKPQDDILDQDADEIELVVTTADKLKLVEAESSSTLILSQDADLNLHCVGEAQSQPVWYYNDEKLDADDLQTVITDKVNTTAQVKVSTLTRMNVTVDGQYQCRDTSAYQADSDVLLVIYELEGTTIEPSNMAIAIALSDLLWPLCTLVMALLYNY